MKSQTIKVKSTNSILLLLFLVSLFGAANCMAQDSTALPANKNFSIKQDIQVASLLYKYKEYNRKREFGEGFRVQITYTDIREEVYKNKASLYNQFPDLSSYVEYEQPYYKLRIGDFKTRLQATYYLQQIVTLYPGAFIVRDKIKIR